MFTKTKLFLGIFILITLTALVVGTLSLPDRSKPQAGQYQSTEYPATISAAVNGCGNIFLFHPDKKWYGTIPSSVTQAAKDDNVPVAPVLVPVYGYMSPEAFPADQVGSYDKTFAGFSRQDINRALWDGYRIIWYSPSISEPNFTILRNFVNKTNSVKPTLILLPYNFKNKAIPLGRDYAYSSWDASQSCRKFTSTDFNSFTQFANEKVSSRGKPPVAPLAPYGGLYPIEPKYNPGK